MASNLWHNALQLYNLQRDSLTWSVSLSLPVRYLSPSLRFMLIPRIVFPSTFSPFKGNKIQINDKLSRGPSKNLKQWYNLFRFLFIHNTGADPMQYALRIYAKEERLQHLYLFYFMHDDKSHRDATFSALKSGHLVCMESVKNSKVINLGIWNKQRVRCQRLSSADFLCNWQPGLSKTMIYGECITYNVAPLTNK